MNKTESDNSFFELPFETDGRDAVRNYAHRVIAEACAEAFGKKASDEFTRAMVVLGAAHEEGSVCAAAASLATEGKTAKDTAEALEEQGFLIRSDRAGIDPLPLVYDSDEGGENRIYTWDNFQQEKRLAQMVARFFADNVSFWDEGESMEKLLELERGEYRALAGNLADVSENDYIDGCRDQNQAVKSALENRFSVVCGGPGTGKTTTVVRILEMMLRSESEENRLRICLAAPTGKAAGRIMESIRSSIERSKGGDEKAAPVFARVAKALEDGDMEQHTIHKWLWTKQSDGRFPSRHSKLDCDVLVLDECSMIEIPLAIKLFEVIDPKRTRVILLGDRFQLSAVGPGSVFADFSDENTPLADVVTRLEKSHRFTESSGIGRLASAVNAGDAQSAIDVARDFARGGGERVAIETGSCAPGEKLTSFVKKWIAESLEGYVGAVAELVAGNRTEESIRRAWKELNRFKALATVREGGMSVAAVNAYAEAIVRKRFGFDKDAASYPGKVIIVRVNSNELGIYNGDVGFVLPAENGKATEVYFGESKQTVKEALLPGHDTAFAITVHQSQGSEYENVLVLLPQDEENPLAVRELVYTGITRAKKEVVVAGPEKVFAKAVGLRTRRISGLKKRLADALKEK